MNEQSSPIQDRSRPSAESWNVHKDTILRMYTREEMKLEDVMKEMAMRYHHVASRRQYQNRFKKWEVRKYMNKQEKERILSSGSNRPSESESVKSFKNVPRKVRRYEIEKEKGIRAGGLGVDKPSSSSPQDQNLDTDTSGVSDIALFGDSAPFNDLIRGIAEFDDQRSFGIGSSENGSQHMGSALGHEEVPLTYPFSLSIPSPLAKDPRDLNLSLLLSCVRGFSEFDLSKSYLQPTQDNGPNAKRAPLDKFWKNVRNCIYLYKINDVGTARPLLDQICSVSSEVIKIPTIGFVRSLLAEFAPVNFRAHPEVRSKLLGHFIKMAEEALGTSHALSLICKELQKDADTRGTTEMALRCMLSCMNMARSPQAFDTERAIIALLRRDKDVRSALQMAENLLNNITAETTAKSDSTNVRRACQELAHIYMDVGRYNEAKDLCLRRVGEVLSRDGFVGHQYNDSCALWAYEDLAKIEEETGALNRSATWLWHALDLTVSLMGPSISISHILDKLTRCLRLCGRDDEAESLSKKYASYTWNEKMDVTKD